MLLTNFNCRVTPLDNATVRWSMTRVRCWWKPLSSELSAGPPPCRFAGDERSSPVPTIPVRQEAPPNAEGLGSLTPGGVASLPPHPARLQRANHAEQVGGDDIQQTNKRTDKQTDGQTNKKTHNKFVEGGWGDRECSSSALLATATLSSYST